MGKDLSGKELGVGLGQRKDGLYTARYVNQFGKRMQIYDKKIAVVRKWLTNVKYEDEHGMLGSGNKITVNEWFDTWVKTYKEGIVKPNTVKNYRNRFKQNISPAIGTLQLKSIKKIQLQQILNTMYDEDYAYGTMNLTLVTIHALFDGAVQSELLTKNPGNGLKCKQREVKEARILLLKEEIEFLRFAKESMYYNVYALSLETGMRSGEVSGLLWEDIDLEKREIHVRRTLLFDKKQGGHYFGSPKNKASIRDIPLSDKAVKILKAQKKLKFKLRCNSKKWLMDETFNDLVFCTVNGNPVNHSTLNGMIIRTVGRINSDRLLQSKTQSQKYIEFESLHMHSLRHTFATRCIENGMKPKVLQKILGHASFSVTMDLYVHTSNEEKHKEIQKCEKSRGVDVV